MRDGFPSASALVQDRPDVDENLLKVVTAFFGIQEERDEHGSTRWTARVESDQPGILSQLASFDPDQKCWRPSGSITTKNTELTPRTKEARNPALPAGLVSSEAAEKPRDDVSSSLISQNPTRQSNEVEWTKSLPETEHIQFFQTFDWSQTSLGPLTLWPETLRLYIHVCLSERRAACIYWGPERIAIYNDKFVPLIGGRHPTFMGSNFEKMWPESWMKLKDVFLQVEQTGTSCALHNYPLFLHRNGYLEETYWLGDIYPLKETDGSFLGWYFTWQETTRQVIQDRRARLIDEAGKQPLEESESTVYHHIYEVFTQYPYDIPMAILYSASDMRDADMVTLHLQHTIGMATSHVAAPKVLELTKTSGGFGPVLREASSTMAEWTIIDRLADSFPEEIAEGIQWVGYGEISRYIVVIPLFVVNKLLKGFVILGLNPRRQLDADHRQYLSELSRQLQHIMTRITTAEQARRREARLTQELAETTLRVNRIATNSRFGIYEINADGTLRWANENFFSLLASSHRDIARFDWRDVILEEDQGLAATKLAQGIMEQVDVQDALRLKRTWQPPSSPADQTPVEVEPFWVLYQAFPNVEDGVVTSLMGCLTDISSLKWAEKVQARSAEAAQRARQRQEEFIDITSHEIRNPLSAVTQCADAIHASFAEAQGVVRDSKALFEIIQENAAAAESILLCAAHQRRIIDDVLTLSKLDSAILNVTPTAYRPASIMGETRMMFSADLSSSDISLEIHFDACEGFNFEDLVYCDPSRLMQVLVNLLTNAIKFTKNEKTRRITIHTGICDEPPTTEKFGPGFNWYMTNKERRDPTVDVEAGQGPVVYLYYAVEDSGRGISVEEAPKIFDKFIQASRRTHIKYGGSGLGLFISRELTEMHGGRIGLHSVVGQGSLFAFYIKARRAVRPSPSLMEETHSHKRSAGSLNTAIGHTQSRKSRLVDGPNRTAHSTPTSTNRSDFHILLVEDNELNQKVMAKQLRKAGCTVAVANHGEEAVDYLLRMHDLPAQYGSPDSSPLIATLDCILMDWEMPVCDGLTATRKIRDLEKDGKFNLIHLILGVTANARTEQIQMAKEAGMQDVLPKPFKIPDLLSKIRTLVPACEDEERDV